MYSYLAWLFLLLRVCERVSTHTRMSANLYTHLNACQPLRIADYTNNKFYKALVF